MFPNWTGWKTVKLVLGALSTAAGALGMDMDLPQFFRTDMTVTGTILGAVTMIVVGLSGTTAGPTVLRTKALPKE